MSIILEESIKHKFRDWSESICIGVLVGQRALRYNYIVHAVKTQIPSFAGPVRILPEAPVTDHSLIITQMSPGGFFVNGIFLITSEELWNTEWNFIKIKNIMRKVHLNLKIKKIFRCGANNDRLLLLQVDPDTQETRSWVFSYEENEDLIQPVKTRFESLNHCFYVGKYSWNSVCPYREIDWFEMKNDFNTYWKSIETFGEDVNKSTLLLNGKKVPAGNLKIRDHLLKNESSSSSEDDDDDFNLSKYRIKDELDFKLFLCVFKPIYNYSWNCIQGESESEKIYVHHDMSILEVCKAVKDDIVRSWASRLQFHVNHLIECNGSRNGNMKKISILLESSKIPFYFYVFENEPLCSEKLQQTLRQTLMLRKEDKYLLLDKDPDFSDEPRNEWSSKKETETGYDYLHLIMLGLFLCLLCIVYHFMFTKKYIAVWK